MATKVRRKPPPIPGSTDSTDIEDEDACFFKAAGFESISRLLHTVYPNQKNHLQAMAVCKFWMGGPDPLDFISMLHHIGDADRGIPEHWHYVTFGFSDLHGDGRVHEYTGRGKQSGFGMELSFRLRRKDGEENAPMWPATLLNSLARYVFKTGNVLNCGDHIPWNRPLDGLSQSRIQHMLVTEDPELKCLDTAYGYLQFRQVVGITEAEMKAVQRWKGSGVVDLLSRVPHAGGIYLVTDMHRKHSIFDLDRSYMHVVRDSIEREGSNLGHVTSACLWEEPITNANKENNANLANQLALEVNGNHQKSLHGVHLRLDQEAAELLPLIVKGRLMKGRYFVFQNVSGQVIIFIPPEFEADMVLVNANNPLMVDGKALQIFCMPDFIKQMAQKFSILDNAEQVRNSLPRVINLHNPSITITVVPVGHIPIS